MKITNVISKLHWFAFTGLVALALNGCLTSDNPKITTYSDDGQGAFIVSEMDQMGQVTGDFSGGVAAKISADNHHKIKGELVVQPMTYDTSCQCFVRGSEFTGTQGFERMRMDTIRLVSITGLPMDHFNIDSLSYITHTRHVTRTGPKNAIDVSISVTVNITTDILGGHKGVWNGTMTGTFNGETFKSGTITDVVRVYDPASGEFLFPESGTVVITRPNYQYTVVFLGNGQAQVTIVKLITNEKVHVFGLGGDYKELGK